jgi:eukaryotic-like serine/threonine-protein kinase
MDIYSMTGKTVSRYRILGTLRDAKYPLDYRAVDIESGRPVALKFLPQHWARHAQLAIPVKDPHLCTTYEVGKYEHLRFIATELLDGKPVSDRLCSGPMGYDLALAIAIDAAEGLAAAHACKLIHADIRPSNIFITRDGNAKVLGLGLASGSVNPQHVDALEAMYGWALKIYAYMSPEQITNTPRLGGKIPWPLQKQDPRIDLFSLGTVLFEMVTGRNPFLAASIEAIFDSVLHQQPTPPTAELAGVFDKSLAKDPDARYQSASEMAADLKRLRRSI